MFRRFRRSEDVIAFAFSGGGSRGASQIGALKALTEAGIWPAMVAGTSAGAVNAAYFALHPHRLDRLEAVWLALRTQDVFPGTRLHILMNFARRGHIHRSDAWEAFLRAEVGTTRFEDMPIAGAVVAVRLRDGERVVFDSGEIVPALMASTAIPGVFPPYRIGDEAYVDGGVLEYLPVPTLLDRGATTIYAMDCSSFSQRSVHNGSVVDRCARIAARSSVTRMVSLQETRGRTVHLLQPELPDFDDARDFGHTAELVLAGYEHATGYLQDLVATPRSGLAAGSSGVVLSEPSPHAG
jgi:NTE family protein